MPPQLKDLLAGTSNNAMQQIGLLPFLFLMGVSLIYAVIAMAILVENGGHGGVVAAPVALQVFQKFFDVDPSSYSASVGNSD